MTVLGLLFIGIGLYLFYTKPIQYLMSFVLIACVFQAGSIINAGGKGIPPYVLCEFFFIVRACWHLPKSRCLKVNKVIICFFLFALLGITLTLFMPFIFKGVSVIGTNTSDQHLAMMQMRDRLSFSSKNIVQILFLISNFITFYLFYLYRKYFSNDILRKTFLYALIIVLVIGFWGFLNKMIGIPFPNAIIYSNVGYGQLYNTLTEFGLARLNATFTEPSYCGGFLAASFWGIYNTFNKYRYLCLLIGVALILNLSSTGLVAFLFGLLLKMMSSWRRLLFYSLSFLFLLFILLQTPYWEYIDAMLFGKAETLSGMARGNSFLLTLELCKNTNFIGLGLGSHRDFSFIGNLLAAVGPIGVCLFLYIITSLQINHYRNRKYFGNNFLLHWGFIHWLAVIIALPDLSYSVIWMWMFASISQYKTPNICESESMHTSCQKSLRGQRHTLIS